MAKSRIAEAYVQIVPSLDGIGTRLNSQLSGELGKAGTLAGDDLAAGVGTGFGAKIKGYMKPALIGLGALAAVGVGSFLKNSIGAASDFAEQGAAVNQVFGDAASTINAFAADSATSLGQSKTQILEASKQFGIYGQAAGLAGKANAEFSTDLVTLATDLASFNNTSVDEALLALSSGLRGEAEPLRKYGVLLDDATLRAKALEMGLVSTTKDALTPQNKVLAANAVIMEQTKIQQGDFARTSDGLANQQRILTANMANLSIAVGSAVLPIMTALTTLLNEQLIPAFGTIFGWIKENIATITAFVGVLGGLLTVFNAIRIATSAWATAQGILNAVMAINPFTAIAIAVAALVAAIVYVATQTTFFQDAWAVMTEFIGNAWSSLYETVIKPVADAIGAVFTFLYENIIRPVYLGIMLYIALWAAAFEFLYNNFIKPIAGLIGELFTALWKNFIKPVVDFIVGGFKLVGEVFSFVWNNVLKPSINAVGDGFSWLWTNAIKPAIDWIIGGFQNLGKIIGDIFNTIVSVVRDAFGGLVGIVRGPINGLIDLLNGMIDGLNAIQIDIPDWVPEFGGKSIGFNIPSIPKLAKGGYVDQATTAIIGEAGPEVVTPLKDFERMMGLDGSRGNTINYYAAPNQSLDAEQALFKAIKRAKVVAGW